MLHARHNHPPLDQLKKGIFTRRNTQPRECFWSSHQLVLGDVQRISRANHWRGLSGAPKMSKVPHHLLCDNYQKYKTYQSCLTATASKQGDRVLVLFPDAVNQHLLLSTFSSTLSSLFSPSRFPVTVQNPFPLSSQELCHVYLGIKHYFFLLVPFHMFSSSVCFVSVLADF